MAEIKPRWEWRSFGERFGPAEAHIAKLSPTGVQESDELYLLSGAGANVKVRDALMDIKVLRDVNADGLEQWTPVLKAAFPLPDAVLAQVLQALGLPLPDTLPDAITQDDFMARFAAPGGAVRAVPVHKRRVRYTIGGCTAELSAVTAAGRSTRTLAVELEDAAAVTAAVHGLGLGAWVNTSYPRGLAALVDGTAERYAVIDAGTNSIKLIVAEATTGGGSRTLVDRAEITRLGEGLSAGGRDPRQRARPRRCGDCRHGRRSAALGRARHRRRRHRRIAHRIERRAGRRRRAHEERRGDRDHLGRRGGPAGLRRRPRRARAEAGHAGDLRHRRRQLAVHLRA
jgi:exopolyphosphatase/guanosine-5'-triphosphate,3'-diphosphate pyrophosphatase